MRTSCSDYAPATEQYIPTSRTSLSVRATAADEIERLRGAFTEIIKHTKVHAVRSIDADWLNVKIAETFR
jgi:hypothetical protein